MDVDGMDDESGVSTFWGCELRKGKTMPFVPPPEDAKLHLSQACLGPGAKSGARAYVKVKVQEGPAMVIAVLRQDHTEMASLDLVFDEYSEFSLEGEATVHLTGYYMPMNDEEEGYPGEDDDEDDEELSPAEMRAMQQMLGRGRQPVHLDGGDDEEEEEEEEDDDDDDSDDDDPFGLGAEGDSDDEGEDDEESEEEDIVVAAANRKSTVVIEEVTDSKQDLVEAATKKRKQDQAALETPAEAKKRAAAAEESAAQRAAATPAQTSKADKQKAAKADRTPAAGKPEAQTSAATGDKTPAAKAEKTLAAAKGDKTPKAAKTPQTAAKQEAPATADAVLNGGTPAKSSRKGVRRFPNGLEIADVALGQPDGKLAKAGKRVKVRYTGRLASNGKVFDSTKGNKTFSFRLGVGEVIKGWDKGVEGMRVGDKRKLTVPASMGYGASGAPPDIPGNATLIFDVELVNVM